MTEVESGQTSTPVIAEAAARILHEGAVAVLATVVEGPRAIGAKVLVEGSGRVIGSTGDTELDKQLAAHAPAFLASRAEAHVSPAQEFAGDLAAWRGARVLFERIAPEPRLVICGAGHVGAALARLAHAIGYRVTLIDDRADFVVRGRFPGDSIELIAADNWSDSIRASVGERGHGVAVVIVTRGHREDEECLGAVLAARPRYVGMIGSRRRTNIVLAQLRAAGVDEALLRDVRAPVGLDIGAVTPEEVALAILAEIVAEQRGGTGAPLSAWRRNRPPEK